MASEKLALICPPVHGPVTVAKPLSHQDGSPKPKLLETLKKGETLP